MKYISLKKRKSQHKEKSTNSLRFINSLFTELMFNLVFWSSHLITHTYTFTDFFLNFYEKYLLFLFI